MAMDFHKSAEELQILRRKLTQTQLPSRSGPKDSVPDESEEQAERLEQQFEQFEEILTEERILRKGNISVGKWNSEKNIAEVEIRKGVHWMVFGKTVCGTLVLQPEEALYMVDHGAVGGVTSTTVDVLTKAIKTRGMLELFYNDLPMPIQQAYELLLSDAFPLHHYVVYSYLRNLGFIVLRHERRKLISELDTLDVEKVKEEMKEIIGGEMEENMEEIVKPKIEGKMKDERDEHLEENMDEINEIMERKMKEVEENMEEKIVNKMEQNVEEKENEEMEEKVEGEMEVEDVGEKMVNKMEEKIEVEKMEKTCESPVNVPETAVPSINENSPVLHYWKDEKCQPLVHPSDSTSLDNILSKLQIVKSQTVMEALQHMHGSSTDFKIQFDVFQPQKQFRKTDPGLPNHSICICKFSDSPPSIGEMNSLACEASPVPLKYAVVDGKDVSFYSMLDVQLPVYTET